MQFAYIRYLCFSYSAVYTSIFNSYYKKVKFVNMFEGHKAENY